MAVNDLHPYDDVAHDAMRRTKAASVILLVLGGDRGSGMSLLTQNPRLVADMPELLRRLADVLEKDGPGGWAPRFPKADA